MSRKWLKAPVKVRDKGRTMGECKSLGTEARLRVWGQGWKGVVYVVWKLTWAQAG